jgi:hypothetical protein
MAGSHASCEQDVTDGHIWGTYPDYIPNVNRMFLPGKCWPKCLNACNVLSMFPLKSRYPRPQCQESMDKEEEFDETLEVAIGYSSSVGTSLWSEIMEDQNKVCLGYGMAMLSWLTQV